MKKELLFYNRIEFSIFKENKKNEGYDIFSITDYIRNNDLIGNIEINSQIIDLTSLGTLHTIKDIQYISEDVLSFFNENIVFIADKKFKELFEYELRFCFEDFIDIELDNENLTNKFDNTNNQKNNLQTKTHRRIIDLNNEELQEFHINFNKSLYGHNKFKEDFVDLINSFRVFNKIGEHKILSLFLLGESGVGKTEVARTIYKCLGGKKKLAKVNFGNYSSEFSLSSLIGSARGYIGSDDGEIFIRTRNTDVGVLLIDEFEKSNATLFNYFLDVLESGKIISSLAEEIDLNGFIIVFTSNIAKEDFLSKISPELRSRFDYKCQFTVLFEDDKIRYTEYRVNEIITKVNKEFEITLPNNCFDELISKINVSKFNNMRDLNKLIKRIFVEYLLNITSIEKTLELPNKRNLIIRKVMNLFQS